MLVSSDRAVKTLLRGEAAKVERGSPAVFIKVRGEVIVMSCQCCILGSSRTLDEQLSIVKSRGMSTFLPRE